MTIVASPPLSEAWVSTMDITTLPGKISALSSSLPLLFLANFFDWVSLNEEVIFAYTLSFVSLPSHEVDELKVP